MIKMNLSTGSPFKEGDSVLYQNKEYILVSRLFKIKEIKELDKQLQMVLIDEKGNTVMANFWKSDYGKDPNIFIDGDNYKLVEVNAGDTIEMVGFEYTYNNFMQFNPFGGYRLSAVEMKMNAAVNVDALMNKMNQIIVNMKDEALVNTIKEAFNTYEKDFLERPAARKHHHNYVGGLLHHTVEVMMIAYSSAKLFNCDIDVVIAASFFHDIMKIKEYTLEGEYLPYANTVGHVTGSAMVFEELAMRNHVDYDKRMKIVHCILAHHGLKEWGSPVCPDSIEASIVHCADLMSSKVNPSAIKDNQEISKDYYIN